MVASAVDWPWSSAATHLGDPDPFGLLDLRWWFQRWAPTEWEEIIGHRLDEAELVAIRKATFTGRPVGSAEFVRHLEGVLGRPLTPRKGGRPSKTAAATAG
jgi:hypothetical protein